MATTSGRVNAGVTPKGAAGYSIGLRRFTNGVGLVCVSILLTLVVGEAVLRVSHVATDVPFVEGDPELGFKYIANQSGYHVLGPFANEKALFRINSDGWNSIRDYKGRHEPGVLRIALIGDSYIEAMNVAPEAAVSASLERRLTQRRKVEIYPFGMAAASLSDYLLMMRYAKAHFAPDFYIINMVHNDFEEWAQGLQSSDRSMFHSIRFNGSAYEEVPQTIYQPSRSRRMVGHMAIGRYVYVNLGLLRHISSYRDGAPRPGSIVANTPLNDEVTIGAVRYLFGKYLEEVGGDRSRLLLTMNAPANAIQQGLDPRTAKIFRYNQLAAELCREMSIGCLDLTTRFVEEFRKSQRPYSSFDGHWNAHAHEVVADAIANLAPSFFEPELMLFK